MSIIKIVIILLLLTIVISLTAALFYLVKDKGKSKRVIRALTVRIALSVTAFLILIFAYMAGFISPNF